MILVYIEHGTHAEHIATFFEEEHYALCVPSLERYAASKGKKLTESKIEQS